MNYDLVLLLLKKGANREFVEVSTTALAEELEVSQQTCSRWLIEAEESGLVERKIGKVKLTKKALQGLDDLRQTLKAKLGEEGARGARAGGEVMGKVVSGMREGGYYLSQPGYVKQIEKKLGFEPYPGTLNLQLSDLEFKRGLEGSGKAIWINGFEIEGRTFGEMVCFRCKVAGISGAIVIPKRSHYGNDVLEIIAPLCLRDKIGLKDGDEVKVKVEK
ncbi:Riboflavin kinase [Candidatus Gugararchaeum adminiculabundum]|nr:Riboflavin kinase [Candidatus Gugararchaeum adminiculabundum]